MRLTQFISNLGKLRRRPGIRYLMSKGSLTSAITTSLGGASVLLYFLLKSSMARGPSKTTVSPLGP